MKRVLWRGVAAVGLAAVAGSIAFTIFGLGASGAVPRTGPLAVRTSSQSPPGRFVRGKVVGELDIDSHFPAAFASEDQTLVEHCASLIGKKLEKSPV